MIWLAIAIGGAFGAMLRYAIIQYGEKRRAPFYRATLLVNVIGSFLMGMAGHLAETHIVTFMLTVGFLGALTTFSTFAFDALRLIKAQKILQAIGYVLTTLVVSFVCIVVGYKII